MVPLGDSEKRTGWFSFKDQKKSLILLLAHMPIKMRPPGHSVKVCNLQKGKMNENKNALRFPEKHVSSGDGGAG